MATLVNRARMFLCARIHYGSQRLSDHCSRRRGARYFGFFGMLEAAGFTVTSIAARGQLVKELRPLVTNKPNLVVTPYIYIVVDVRTYVRVYVRLYVCVNECD